MRLQMVLLLLDQMIDLSKPQAAYGAARCGGSCCSLWRSKMVVMILATDGKITCRHLARTKSTKSSKPASCRCVTGVGMETRQDIVGKTHTDDTNRRRQDAHNEPVAY